MNENKNEIKAIHFWQIQRLDQTLLEFSAKERWRWIDEAWIAKREVWVAHWLRT